MVVDIKYFWEASKTIFNSDLLFYDYVCSLCEHINYREIKIIFNNKNPFVSFKTKLVKPKCD